MKNNSGFLGEDSSEYHEFMGFISNLFIKSELTPERYKLLKDGGEFGVFNSFFDRFSNVCVGFTEIEEKLKSHFTSPLKIQEICKNFVYSQKQNNLLLLSFPFLDKKFDRIYNNKYIFIAPPPSNLCLIDFVNNFQELFFLKSHFWFYNQNFANSKSIIFKWFCFDKNPISNLTENRCSALELCWILIVLRLFKNKSLAGRFIFTSDFDSDGRCICLADLPTGIIVDRYFTEDDSLYLEKKYL